MLNLESAWILPVVENLAAQDVSSHAPDALPPLLRQPLMTHQLSIKVGYFIGAVMDVSLLDFGGSALHEEAVMVRVCFAEI